MVLRNAKDASDEPFPNIQYNQELPESHDVPLEMDVGHTCRQDYWETRFAWQDKDKKKSIDSLCVYEYVADDKSGKFHIPCVDGYHLQSCKHMYCSGTFKCPSTYCLRWKYVCNAECDCPYCEDETICHKLSCPGMVLRQNAAGLLYCHFTFNKPSHALILNSTSLNGYINKQFICKSSNYANGFQYCPQSLNDTVYLDVSYGTYLSNIPHIWGYWQTIIFCNITHYSHVYMELGFLKQLFNVQVLDLSNNKLVNTIWEIFNAMLKLVFLDLSYNQISHIYQNVLNSSTNLRYLILHDNQLIQFDKDMLNNKLVVLMLHNNQIIVSSVIYSQLKMQSSLSILTSDIPRLCCIVSTVTSCSPKFTSFVTCKDMIHSKIQITYVWTMGSLIFILNLACILFFLNLYKSLKRFTCAQRFILVTSFNISLADILISGCLLSLPFYNLYFYKVFGFYADQWTQSINCSVLQCLSFVSSEASLIFAIYLSVHTTTQLTTIIPRFISRRNHYVNMICIWALIVVVGVAKQIIWYKYNANEYNYYCLPFQIPPKTHLFISSIHISIIVINILLIFTYCTSYSYLLLFINNSEKANESTGIRKIKGIKRLKTRLTFLILSNILTWTPLLIIQCFSLLRIQMVQGTVFLWIVFISLPVNLLLDPVLFVFPLMINFFQKNKS